MKFAHSNIIAQDWRKLADFYCTVFQCELLLPERNLQDEWLGKGSGIPGATLTGAHLRLPGFGENGPTLEIFQYSDYVEPKTKDPHRLGFGHIAFQVDNVQEVVELALSHGATMQGEMVAVDIPGAGKIDWVYVRDPEGNVVEIQRWH